MRFAVRLDLGAIPSGQDLTAQAFPNLAFALNRLASTGLNRWTQYASGAPLPNGQRITPRSGAYLKSIQIAQASPYRYSIFSDAPYAAAIERGTGPRDLKEMLNTSLKVRTTKDGRRYLIIPFRWGTGTGSGGGISFGKQVMPESAYLLAKDMAPSHIIGHGWRVSGNDPSVMVRKREYSWGDRLGKGDLLQSGVDKTMAHRLSGLVKMQGVQGKHSQYLTFRVMMEGGGGWMAPAQPGRWPARTVADELSAVASRILRQALKTDIAALTQ